MSSQNARLVTLQASAGPQEQHRPMQGRPYPLPDTQRSTILLSRSPRTKSAEFEQCLRIGLLFSTWSDSGDMVDMQTCSPVQQRMARNTSRTHMPAEATMPDWATLSVPCYPCDHGTPGYLDSWRFDEMHVGPVACGLAIAGASMGPAALRLFFPFEVGLDASVGRRRTESATFLG
ncbi:hypothetical protein OH76DRAFT_682795 [Lentinus brumalis]|uniref:Uncharacterized protein n=1 Tax=Lentinus brumalis TaxID=2498619 RepID=A0A371D6P2_9APHY|nr:hypothetical protein OH76DRAFT_682795 [Polyporus brumalis]